MERSRPTVLVVDDTPSNLSLLNQILKTDYAVKAANNGLKALEIAHQMQPDLILLDVMMPGIDGFEVCRRLKAHPHTRHIPVIFLTAKTEIEDETLGFAVGAADFIHKPISPPIVELRVRNHLQIKLLQDYLQSQSEQERAQKVQLMQIFSKHVSSEIAATLWQQRDQFLGDQRPPPQKMTATVLFSDIRNFTRISEQLDPNVLFDWLNTYMDVMTSVVLTQQGVVNKYIGDAIMAVFGLPQPNAPLQDAPRCAQRAVDCALAMRAALPQLNQQFAQQGLPMVAIRIGIATGTVAAGTLGNTQRLEYTVIGDTVNTAARLEETREVIEDDAAHCRILISEYTLSHLSHRYQTEPVGALSLKGKFQRTGAFRLVGEQLVG